MRIDTYCLSRRMQYKVTRILRINYIGRTMNFVHQPEDTNAYKLRATIITNNYLTPRTYSALKLLSLYLIHYFLLRGKTAGYDLVHFQLYTPCTIYA